MIHIQKDTSLAKVIVNAVITAAPQKAVALENEVTTISPASITVSAMGFQSLIIQNPQDDVLYLVSRSGASSFDITEHPIVG